MELLGKWTGRRWMVSLSERDAGAPTLAQQETANVEARKARAAEHPLVRRALDMFPGATLEAVHGPGEQTAAASTAPEERLALDEAPPDLDLIPDSIDLEGDDP
jgi:DNA polymerase-3 subunit gamma/tau